jgi:thiamine pyrophosphokinase
MRIGVAITGGEGPPPQELRRLIEGAVRSSNTGEALLAAADSGLLLAEAAGLKPDWVIGDMDSLDNEERLRSYPADRVIRHPADKDYTDTELALSLLRDKGCDEVWIAGGGGGRIDHLLGIRDLFERERFPRRWLTAAEDIYCIDGGDDGAAGGSNAALTMTIAQGGVVSVFPLGDGPWKASSSGLKWPLDKVSWKRGVYGLSNVTMEPEMTINAQQGRFMIIMEGMWRRV